MYRKIGIFSLLIIFFVSNFFIFQSVIAAAWSISSTSYDNKSKNVSAQLERITSTFFNDDGTIMYVLGGQNPVYISQYTLSTAWDVSTAVYANKSYTVSNNSIYWGEALFLKPDGSAAYVVSGYSDKIYQFPLATPWDISTASYNNASSTLQDSEPSGIFFKPDGTKMYLAGNAVDSVYQYSLSSPWDITSATYDSVSYALYAVISGSGSTAGVFFKDDGTKMFSVDTANDKVSQFTLSSGWDLSTVTYDSIDYSVSSQSSFPADIFIKPDGGKMYITEYTNKVVYQYSLVDTTAPTVSSFLALDNATDIDVDATFRVTFNEAVSTSTGNIYLKKTSDDSIIETIDTSSSKVTRFSSTAFTINPAATLAAETGYYFTMDAGSILDSANNSFTGISANTTWNFTTENAATIQTTDPTDITRFNAELNAVIHDIKSATITRRGFVYGTAPSVGTTWALTGSELSISNVTTPALAALTSTTVAYIDATNDQLRTYSFDGNTWSLIGSGLSISTVGNPALTALDASTVAFVDATNDQLRTYRFDGSTWSLIGSGLSISTVGVPALATLTSSTVAFIDASNDHLRTYSFDGSTWSQVGNNLSITLTAAPALATLNSTDIAFTDGTIDQLRTYRFNGTDWAQTGNSLSITSVGTPALASINTSTVSYFDSTNLHLRTYVFNGSTWSQTGSSAYISSAGTAALSTSNSSTIAFIDSTNDKLRTHQFGPGNTTTSTAGYDFSVEETGSFSTGSFNASLTELNESTNYYTRAFAENSYGIVYGNEMLFTTLSDTTPPTITDVSSNKTNGSYKTGDVIDIDVTFSEEITSTGEITITLETGDADRTCAFTLSNAASGTCNYTIQAGDSSNDLTVNSISGTITDQAGNALVDFIPATNLADNKALVILGTNPAIALAGDATQTISVGESYSDLGATAMNALAHDITIDIITSGTVDTTVAGTYTIIYSVTDSAGNTASPITRTITVNPIASIGIVVTPPTPKFIGMGTKDVHIPMGESKHIGIVDTTGMNVMTYIHSPSTLQTLVSNYHNAIIQSHQIQIIHLDLLTNVLTLEIRSFPQEVTLRLDESATVDLDKDGNDDIKIIFEDIVVNRAELTFTSLVRSEPSENTPASTPHTKDTPQTTFFSRTLSYGMTGADVRDLQKFLNATGIPVSSSGPGSPGKETTYFGKSTRSALTNYQKAYSGGNVSGILDAPTRAQILSKENNKKIEDIPLPKKRNETIAAQSTMFTRNLDRGMSGEDVRILQQYLNKHNYAITASGPGSHGNETTFFGTSTQLALQKFQKTHNLPAFGYFGTSTRNLIDRR